MKKRKSSTLQPLLLPLALQACLLSPSQSATITLVTGDVAREAPLIAHLEAQGHSVVTGAFGALDTTASDVTALNSADLVIISRNTNSGDYASNATEVAIWDGLATPVLLGNAYISRNNRWSMVNTAAIQVDYGFDLSAPTGTTTVHPFFTGMTPNTIADPAISGLDKYSFSVSSDIPDGGTVMGDGMTIAVRNNASFQNVIVATWAAGEMTGSGNVLGDDRFFYAMPEDFANFDANGVRLLDNIVNTALGAPVPEPGTLALVIPAALGFLRRRR